MGLFDDLKKGLGSIMDEVDKHKDDIQREINKLAQQRENEPQPAERQQEPAPQHYEERPINKNAPDCFDKFDRIIAENFSDWVVRKNVSASELQPDCHPKCAPISYLFFNNGTPVLAIALVRTNNYRGMNVIATKKICEDYGIRYIRFYHEYDNKDDYVVNRIKENL